MIYLVKEKYMEERKAWLENNNGGWERDVKRANPNKRKTIEEPESSSESKAKDHPKSSNEGDGGL